MQVQDMKNIEARIAAHPLAKSLSKEALAVIVSGAREHVFEPGQIILRPNQPANSLYLIEEGKVAVEAHTGSAGDQALQVIGAGSAFGWSWLFAPFTWHLQARAVERTSVLQLNGGHILAHCERNHKVGYEIMKQISQMLIARLQAARRQLVERRETHERVSVELEGSHIHQRLKEGAH
jgi:CRP-like cAMP-binding protein